MRFFCLPLCYLLCFCSSLFAQDDYFQLNGGLGESSLFNSATISGFGANLSLEYHRPLTLKSGFFVGIGSQYTNFEDQSISTPCNFFPGLKVVTFNTTEFYEVHRTDLTLNLGLTHQAGKFRLRGSLIPTLRLSDRIDARIIQDFFSIDRPERVEKYSVQPGERFNPDGPVEYTIDYSDKFQLQGEIGLSYAVDKQIYLGIAYRQGLTKYELQYKTVGYCQGGTCEEVNNINSRIDARTGHGYITLGYTF